MPDFHVIPTCPDHLKKAKHNSFYDKVTTKLFCKQLCTNVSNFGTLQISKCLPGTTVKLSDVQSAQVEWTDKKRMQLMVISIEEGTKSFYQIVDFWEIKSFVDLNGKTIENPRFVRFC